MSQPLHNPFYALLLVACGLLIVTMLIYLSGYYAVPSPYDNEAGPAFAVPGWVQWVDRNALILTACEAGMIVVFGVLAIGLDRFFEKKRSGTTEEKPEIGDEST